MFIPTLNIYTISVSKLGPKLPGYLPRNIVHGAVTAAAEAVKTLVGF